MADTYYKEHFINEMVCPVDFHTDVFRKNTVHISSVTANKESEIVFYGNHIPNWHKNLEILYCLEGEGNMLCASKNYPFLPGDIFVVNSESTHMVSNDNMIKYHCLIVDYNFLMASCVNISQIEFCARIRDDNLCKLFMNVADELYDADYMDTEFKINIRIKVLELMRYLVTNHVYTTDRKKLLSPVSSHCKNAIKYISQNFARDITIDEIAAHCMVNKAYLSRVFKKETGETMVDFINAMRCNEARKLISQGSSIKEASTSCGFNNLSYFSKTYKKHMGYLPSDDKR